MMWVNRFGAKLGNWNDNRYGHYDRRVDASLRWRILDSVAHELYIWGEI